MTDPYIDDLIRWACLAVILAGWPVFLWGAYNARRKRRRPWLTTVGKAVLAARKQRWEAALADGAVIVYPSAIHVLPHRHPTPYEWRTAAIMERMRASTVWGYGTVDDYRRYAERFTNGPDQPEPLKAGEMGLTTSQAVAALREFFETLTKHMESTGLMNGTTTFAQMSDHIPSVLPHPRNGDPFGLPSLHDLPRPRCVSFRAGGITKAGRRGR